ILIVILVVTNILTFVFAYTQRLESQMHQQQAYENMIRAQEVETLSKKQAEEARRQAEIARHEALKAKELADELSNKTK
ncbi:MAG: hypothetical protein OEX22_02290, partial [Cyclobacteriaceae bacterium]|nr:hypothetical protein [Cyclobacteriaceae bacterium]